MIIIVLYTIIKLNTEGTNIQSTLINNIGINSDTYNIIRRLIYHIASKTAQLTNIFILKLTKNILKIKF